MAVKSLLVLIALAACAIAEPSYVGYPNVYAGYGYGYTPRVYKREAEASYTPSYGHPSAYSHGYAPRVYKREAEASYTPSYGHPSAYSHGYAPRVYKREAEASYTPSYVHPSAYSHGYAPRVYKPLILDMDILLVSTSVRPKLPTLPLTNTHLPTLMDTALHLYMHEAEASYTPSYRHPSAYSYRYAPWVYKRVAEASCTLPSYGYPSAYFHRYVLRVYKREAVASYTPSYGHPSAYSHGYARPSYGYTY
ncbi:unnamed protein product [Lepeophtheirus salmonis]|uniref:(salmon louse) hypothetical protein n=1 Tax=Lepeophtheirus salmonis TaxID=72036 RepID=A0A7R8CTE2_LEPSM|nr:unnamed protein product [Lepeophtheirus salmonis]CAF2923433.1 unnamed protein product [Lepeophtheirus salmonis]